MADSSPNGPAESDFLHAVLDAAPWFLAVLDDTGSVLWAAGDSASMVGLDASELVGRNLFDFVPDRDLPLALESMEYAIRQDRPFKPMEFRYLRGNGSIGVAEAASVNRLTDPRIGGIVLQVRDITDRSVTDQVLEAIAAGGPMSTMLRLVARLVETRLPACRVIVAVDPSDDHFAVAASSLDSFDQYASGRPTPSPADVDLTEPGTDDVDPPWAPVIADGRARIHEDLSTLPAAMRAEAEEQGFAACWVFPVFIPTSGDVEGCVIVWRLQAGGPSPGERVAAERGCRLVAIALERRGNQELLLHAARHDALTALPNRSVFYDRLARELQRGEHPVAVLYLDLDGFKSINDRYGHRAGDHVLVTVARRIAEGLRPGDLVARLGGDEFGVVCPRLNDPREAEQIAARLIAAVGQPVRLPAGTLRSPELALLAGAPVAGTNSNQPVVVDVGASIGIAFSEEGVEHERLVEQADAAMYDAKRRGRGTWRMAARPTEVT